MFSASSRHNNRINQDGTYNVMCWSCNEFIARSPIRVERALCEICRRVENGEPLSEEAIRQYKMAKMDKIQDVSMVVLPDVQPKALKTFSLRSLGGIIAEAVGIKQSDKPVLKSAEVAKRKRRPRLFSEGQLETLGSIEELDKKLK